MGLAAKFWVSQKMELTTETIEVVGTVDKKSQLHIDEPLPIAGPIQVPVIVLFPWEKDTDVDSRLRKLFCV